MRSTPGRTGHNRSEDGGITLIRISDNGSGIEREDIHNAFLRHSTSKIESVDDLIAYLCPLVSVAKPSQALLP